MSLTINILSVADQKTEQDFYSVPRIIYANDPIWIPHLRQDIEKIFDPKSNKLLARGAAKRWIVKDTQGRLVGRIAAFVNAKTSKTFDQPTGGIGFFESTDDFAVTTLLLDTAKQWLIEQGMEAMDGPINFGDKNQFWGLLVENFTSPNSYGMNYNPPYYRDLLERYGFQTYFKQFVYSRPLKQPVEEVFVRKARAAMSKPGIRVSDVRGYSTERIAKDFLTVYNGAWGGHAGFKAMTEAAALKVAKSLKPIMDPEIIVFVYADDVPIAFYVNIPELNEIFCHVDGNLNWLGKLKFLYYKWRKTPKTMVGIVFGVVRSYHGQGIEGALIQWFGDHKVGRVGYDTTIMNWIGDFNPKMMRVAENLGTEVHRTYITYRYLFDREQKFERCPIVQ